MVHDLRGTRPSTCWTVPAESVCLLAAWPQPGLCGDDGASGFNLVEPFTMRRSLHCCGPGSCFGALNLWWAMDKKGRACTISFFCKALKGLSQHALDVYDCLAQLQSWPSATHPGCASCFALHGYIYIYR